MASREYRRRKQLRKGRLRNERQREEAEERAFAEDRELRDPPPRGYMVGRRRKQRAVASSLGRDSGGRFKKNPGGLWEIFKKYWWVAGLGVGVWLWSRAATASKSLDDLAEAVARKVGMPNAMYLTAEQHSSGAVRITGTYNGKPGHTFLTASSLAEAWQKAQLLSPQNPAVSGWR